jgi:malonyl-CoA O-methyltransferase
MSAPPSRFELDRHALARAFNRAGAGYDEAAWLQQRARSELLERLEYFRLTPQMVLDVGAGTCQASGALARRFTHARVLAIDLAWGMLAAAPRARWRARYARICADASALPLPAGSADLVFSNLMLQWCDRPGLLLAELARVLKPGGVLVFSSFGPASLQELREAWSTVDAGAHVSEFADLPQLGDALMMTGFVEPVLDTERVQRHYADAYALMRELKHIGAHNAARERSRGLTGRHRMARMISAYERLRTSAGLPATYELIFGAAFRGEARDAALSSSLTSSGEYTVPVGSLRRRRP